MKIRVVSIMLALVTCIEIHAQDIKTPVGEPLAYEVVAGDTVYYDYLEPARVSSRARRRNIPAMWRKRSKLIYNFNKVYPYALVGRGMMAQVDSTLEADPMSRGERNRYINDVEKELFRLFEKDLRSMTISQGYVLLRLVDRECGMSPYILIQTYEGNFAANFWNLVAKIFDHDLKRRYTPEDESSTDYYIEKLVGIWEAGNWDSFYFYIFGQDPPKTVFASERLSEPRRKK